MLMASSGVSEEISVAIADKTALPLFLEASDSISPVSAVFLVNEEWRVVNWEQIMAESGIAERKREAVITLMRANSNYRTGVASSNRYSLVFYCRDAVQVEIACYGVISEASADLLRKGEIQPLIRDMTCIWRSTDRKLMKRTKDGEWGWYESSRPIPDFVNLISGCNLPSGMNKEKIIANAKEFQVTLENGEVLWTWGTGNEAHYFKLKNTMRTDAKGRTLGYDLAVNGDIVFRTHAWGYDLPGKEFGNYEEEELIPTADRKGVPHYRRSFECLPIGLNKQEMNDFVQQTESVANPITEGSDSDANAHDPEVKGQEAN